MTKETKGSHNSPYFQASKAKEIAKKIKKRINYVQKNDRSQPSHLYNNKYMWLNPTIRKQKFSDWSKKVKFKYPLPLRDTPKTKMPMLI